MDYFKEKENHIIYQGKVLNDTFRIQNDELLLPFDFVKKYIDPMIHLDEATSSVIITTKNKVIQFKNEELQAFINEKPFDLNSPVFKEGEEWFIPYHVMKEFYPYELTYSSSSQLVILNKKGEPIKKAKIDTFFDKKEIPIRLNASSKEPIISFVSTDEVVSVFGEKNGWVLIQKQNGHFGYIKNNHIGKKWDEEIKWIKEKDFTSTSLEGKKINLVWEAVYKYNPNVDNLPDMKGVNVVSPTWFELVNNNGDVQSKADKKYVKWAHQNDMQVWGLFSNSFDPDLTHEVLYDFDKRMHMIKQLLTYAEIYDLDGINIDFENVYLEDKEELVQFVRELTPYLHKQELVVSMDVTLHSSSEMWSLFYDRKKLAETVDYIAVMTYDEHPANSPIPGSVASLTWVEEGLQKLLSEVPSEKLLLGIPFYTRVWTETEEGVKADTLSMEYTEAFIKEHKLKPKLDKETNQYFVTFYDKEMKANRHVWLENEHSLKKRLELFHEYDLAGIAIWQRSFADNKMWKVIDRELYKK